MPAFFVIFTEILFQTFVTVAFCDMKERSYVKIYKAIILSRSEDSGLFTFNLQKKSF